MKTISKKVLFRFFGPSNKIFILWHYPFDNSREPQQELQGGWHDSRKTKNKQEGYRQQYNRQLEDQRTPTAGTQEPAETKLTEGMKTIVGSPSNSRDINNSRDAKNHSDANNRRDALNIRNISSRNIGAATSESVATAETAGLLWNTSNSRDVSSNGKPATPTSHATLPIRRPQKCRQIKIENWGNTNFWLLYHIWYSYRNWYTLKPLSVRLQLVTVCL